MTYIIKKYKDAIYNKKKHIIVSRKANSFMVNTMIKKHNNVSNRLLESEDAMLISRHTGINY